MKAIDEQVRIDKPHDLSARQSGDDQPQAYPALGEVVQEIIEQFQQRVREQPSSRARPMVEVVVPVVPTGALLLASALVTS
jgi:hypothetical protein